MPEEKNINISIALIELKCDRFRLINSDEQDRGKITIDKYEYVFAVTFNLLEDTRQATSSIVVTLNDNRDPNNKKELAELAAHAVFHVANYDEIVTKFPDNRPAEYPVRLIEICNDITMQSVRGMFNIKMQDTPYNNSVIQLFLPNALVPQHLLPKIPTTG